MKIGTVFMGNVNKHRFKLLKIERTIAIIEDLTTGKIISYGVEALKHLDITILEGDNLAS